MNSFIRDTTLPRMTFPRRHFRAGHLRAICLGEGEGVRGSVGAEISCVEVSVNPFIKVMVFVMVVLKL